MGREAAVDRPFQPLHVEQHVDRDDDDQDEREEEEDDLERRAARERERVARIPRELSRRQRVDPLVRLLANLHRLEPVIVQQRLQPIDVVLGRRQAGASVLLRNVCVDPVGRSPALVDHDRRDEEQCDHHGGDEEQVDDPHGQAAGQPQPLEIADEGVESEGDDRRGQEEEQRMTQRARERPRQQREHRKPHELDPPRDRDRRGALGRRRAGFGHRPDRIVAPLPPTAAGTAQFRLSEHAASATVQAMATPRSRQSARLRARRRRAQRRARRLALLAVVSLLGVVTLVLTAFGSGTPARQEGTAAPPPAAATLVTGTPGPLALATVSNVKLQLPVPESAVTAIGYHGTRNGALIAASARPPGERGPARAAVAPHRRQPPRRTRLVPARRRAADPGAGRGSSSRHRCLRTGRRHARRDSRPGRRRPRCRRADRHPADARAVGDRVALAPARRPVAQRRLVR